jgi:hypothetical protein
MPIYSFGVNSILKVEITEEQAETYNRFTQAFFDAQEKMRDEGTPWEPDTPIFIACPDWEFDAYNVVAGIINVAGDLIDQEATPITIESDFLEKN